MMFGFFKKKKEPAVAPISPEDKAFADEPWKHFRKRREFSGLRVNTFAEIWADPALFAYYNIILYDLDFEGGHEAVKERMRNGILTDDEQRKFNYAQYELAKTERDIGKDAMKENLDRFANSLSRSQNKPRD